MAGKAVRSADNLMEAFNLAMTSGFAAVDAGMAQTTATVKLTADAAQTERAEYGKVWERITEQARKRNDSLASILPAQFQGMAAYPVSCIPVMSAGAQDPVSKLVESELAFYQSCTQAWMEYIGGVEQRRSEAAQGPAGQQ